MIILFAGYTYEAGEGIHDIKGIFETVIEAREYLQTLNKDICMYDWAQIFLPLSNAETLEEKTVFFTFERDTQRWVPEKE